LRIAIADPALIDNTGHCLNYAVSLTNEFQSREHFVRLFGHLDSNDALKRNFGVEPAFSLGYYHSEFTGMSSIYPDSLPPWLNASYSLIRGCIPRRTWRRRLRSNLDGKILLRRMVSDFRLLDSMMQFTHDDLLLLNTMNAIGALGLVRWLRELPHDRRPIAILILHYVAQREARDSSDAIGRWERFFVETRAAGLERQILIAADTSELADDFATIGQRTVATLPIPHTGAATRTPRIKQAGQPFTVVYAGIGTRTKGFDLLPKIIEGLTDLVERGRIAFRIQANIVDSSAEAHRAVTNLRTLKTDLIDGPLESEAYYDLLANADILLQPHDPAYYRMQSSGVFTEGRAAGLIAIVPAQTTMAEEISRTGGGIAVDDWTAAAYARAIRCCIANFDRLASEADAAARTWKKLHSAEGLRLALNSILPPTHQL
jgi:glycosyltransferase involved in cell wall biosynthesis